MGTASYRYCHACAVYAGQLLMAFDYGEIEQFQNYFALLDVDNSGDLSGREVRLLLKALDVKVLSVRPCLRSLIAECYL